MTCRILLLLSAAATCVGAAEQSRAGSAAALSLAVQASVDVATLKKGARCFQVDTAVTNTGPVEVEIVVWTNYGWSWMPDGPRIVLNASAFQNVSSHRRLASKQSYRAKLDVCRADAQSPPGAFRLGFVPRAEGPVSTGLDTSKWGGVFWSNEMNLSE